jgi:23S rRNA pseudouridine2605 synthase
MATAETKERIQKVLATAGVASRREIEAWIVEGRIEVNGVVATPGVKVGPHDRIRVDGAPLRRSRHTEPMRVLLYKKRVGEVVTNEDPEGRRTVFRKLPRLDGGRWIAVGRLDINTSGMLLLTNHGELAHRLMHPSYEMARSYAVRVHGPVDAEMLKRLKRGVELDDGPARFDSLRAVQAPDDPEESGGGGGANQWFEVTLHEGRNRVVRRLWDSQGCEVSRLIRIGFGPIKLGRGIRSGSFRELDAEEIASLTQAVGLSEVRLPKGKGGKAGKPGKPVRKTSSGARPQGSGTASKARPKSGSRPAASPSAAKSGSTRREKDVRPSRRPAKDARPASKRPASKRPAAAPRPGKATR